MASTITPQTSSGGYNRPNQYDVEDHRMELLMSYTVFHIGLYMSLIAAVVATETGFNLFSHAAVAVAVFSFFIGRHVRSDRRQRGEV